MHTERDFHRLNLCTLVALVACIAAVIGCYVWIDPPVALYVHDHHVNQSNLAEDLTQLPPGVQNFAPLLLLLLVVRRAWGPWARWQKTLLVACICVILAEQFRSSLASVCGRLWPDTWYDNPSFIGTGDYGFRPFEFETGRQAGSFPSGHAARILGFATVWWLAARAQPLAVDRRLSAAVSESGGDELPFRGRYGRRQLLGQS